MTARVVPKGLVREARSKMVSDVIGTGCGSRRRDPYARCSRMSSPRPTSTTTPGTSPLATASLAASSMPEKSRIPETSFGGAKADAGSASRPSSITPTTGPTSPLEPYHHEPEPMTPSPFSGASRRRAPSQPADLNARIEAQLRERLEEAVDFVCLEALVKRRQAL